MASSTGKPICARWRWMGTPSGWTCRLKELLSLLRRHSSNLNQLVRRVNTTGRVYEADLEDIIKRQSELWEAIGQILTRLAEIS